MGVAEAPRKESNLGGTKHLTEGRFQGRGGDPGNYTVISIGNTQGARVCDQVGATFGK